MIASELSSKVSHTSFKLKSSYLFQGTLVERDPCTYEPMNGQVCLAAIHATAAEIMLFTFLFQAYAF